MIDAEAHRSVYAITCRDSAKLCFAGLVHQHGKGAGDDKSRGVVDLMPLQCPPPQEALAHRTQF